MKPFQLSAPASEELAAAVTWYETRRTGLGGDFYDAVVRTIDLIRAHPEVGTLRVGRVAHRRFPVARSRTPWCIASAKAMSLSLRSRTLGDGLVTGQLAAEQAG